MEDRPTQAEIRKTDMVTGEELPGAVLVLKDKNGRVVDRWTSGNTPHRIMGRLNAGELYTLSEVTAPSGYQIAEEVTFTVSEDGTIDRVVMEDKERSRKYQKNQRNRKNRNGRYRTMTEKRNRKRQVKQRLRKLSRRKRPGKRGS
ncbi:MAG: collagen binding domain-containing protein [Enterocloster sp.]